LGEEREKRSRGWRGSRFKTTPHPVGGNFLSPPNGERIEVRGFDVSN